MVFLGGFGAHRFYLGRTGSALAMVALLVASFVLTFVFFVGVIGYFVLAVWVIVDAFLIPGIAREYNQALMQRLDAHSRSLTTT